ncbi:MAG: hypothetical protein ACP5M7_09470 [Thermoproteota archaeon]
MFVRKKARREENYLHLADEERLYETVERGFTDAVIEKLRPRLVFTYGTYAGTLNSQELLSVEHLIPQDLMETERQNYSPTLKDFFNVAKKEPRATFMAYVVPKERPDERITVEGACVPKERTDLIEYLKEKALHHPDDEGEVKDYYCMWWD